MREDFPLIKNIENIHYLDSGATTQKPQCVLDAVKDYYEHKNGNAGRGSHDLAIQSSLIIEDVRKKTAKFIGAKNPNEIIFTKNCTESLNIISYCYALEFLKPEDEILIAISNHHANLVNWQYACQKTGAVLKYIYLDSNGNLDMDDFKSKLSAKTKLVSFSYVVNATGVVNPAKEIIDQAHAVGAVVVLDAAQSITHFKHDVMELDCDFLTFSGHKLYSEFGVGVLYGKMAILNKMPPFIYGGEMIEFVEEQKTTYNTVPHKYEGGTMNAGAICSLGAALDYFEKIGFDALDALYSDLESYLIERLQELDYVEMYQINAEERAGIVAFNVIGVHSHDVAYILNEFGVMVRSGHHCTQPLMKHLGINSSLRASFGAYNTRDDIDALITALDVVREKLL